MHRIQVPHVAKAIQTEYLELPGLSLTVPQVQRLFAVDGLTSEAILAALVDVRFLARNGAGRYVRTDDQPRGRRAADRPGRQQAA